MDCPHCGKRIRDKVVGKHLGAKGGSARTPAKQAASRRNGCLGGRPRITVRRAGKIAPPPRRTAKADKGE